MKRLFTLIAGIIICAGTVFASEAETVMLEEMTSSAISEFMSQATANLDNYNAIYNQFVLNKSKMFKTEDLDKILTLMEGMTEKQLIAISGADYLDPTINLIVSILVGGLGVDRFLIGNVGAGVGKLLTMGGLGVWWLIDIFLIQNKTKDHNYDLFNEACVYSSHLK